MARLIIHAGDCKAGSTAIQSVLKAGSYRLDGGSTDMIAYAEAGRRGALNHQRLSNSLFMEEAAKVRDQAWGRLGEEWRGSTAQNLVISSERFEFADPKEVRAALEKHMPKALETLKIMLYVRPHADRLLSGYAQNVKQGLFTGDLAGFVDEMVDNGRLAYCDRLLSWREVFGADAVEIRPMIRASLYQECVVHDFLSFCVNSDAVMPVVEKIPNSNSALDARGLELMREIWTRVRRNNPANDQFRSQVINRFASGLEAQGGLKGDKIALTAPIAARMAELFGDDARRCDAEVFGTPVLAPRLESAVADASAVSDTPNETDAAVVASGAAQAMIWMQMMQDMRMQQAQQARQAQKGGGAPGGGGGRQRGRAGPQGGMRAR